MDGPVLPIRGGCGCGAVRFEVDEPFVAALYCHCTRCQRRTGAAASANASAKSGSVRIVAGEERLKAWAPAGGFEKLFCGDCGSAVFSRNPRTGDLGVRLGAVDGDPGIRPQWHQYVAYAVAWEPIPDDGLPRHPEHRTS
jgi:hypothetical protein